MTAPPTESTPNRKRRWPRVLLAVVLVLVVAYGIYRYTLHRMVESRLDAIRKEGYPVTLADLEKYYSEPKGGNAAPIYWQAFTKYTNSFYTERLSHDGEIRLSPPEFQRSSRFGPDAMRGTPGHGRSTTEHPPVRYEKLPLHGESMSVEAKRILSDWIRQNAEALGLLHLAASIRECRFPINLGDGVKTALPHPRRLWDACRLLEVEALCYTDDHNAEKAIESVVSSFAIGRSLVNEPFPESQFFRSYCTHIAVETLQSVLQRVSLDESQLKQLSDACYETESTNAWFRTMQCERARISYTYSDAPLMMFDNYESEYPDLKWIFAFGAYRCVGLLEWEHLWALSYMGRVAAVMQQPYPQRIKAAAEVDARYAQETRGKMLALMHAAFGAWPKASERVWFEATAVAARNNTLTALAVERWRLRNGDLPQTLDDLVPDYLQSIPRDPFDGQPLRFKRLPKGFVVYSVGQDGVDDGGFWTNRRPMHDRDITFTVER